MLSPCPPYVSRCGCGSCVAVPDATHVLPTWFLECALREREMSRFRKYTEAPAFALAPVLQVLTECN